MEFSVGRSWLHTQIMSRPKDPKDRMFASEILEIRSLDISKMLTCFAQVTQYIAT